MFSNGFFGGGFFGSYGMPDLNHDGEVDATDVYIYEEVLDDDD